MIIYDVSTKMEKNFFEKGLSSIFLTCPYVRRVYFVIPTTRVPIAFATLVYPNAFRRDDDLRDTRERISKRNIIACTRVIHRERKSITWTGRSRHTGIRGSAYVSRRRVRNDGTASANTSDVQCYTTIEHKSYVHFVLRYVLRDGAHGVRAVFQVAEESDARVQQRDRENGGVQHAYRSAKVRGVRHLVFQRQNLRGTNKRARAKSTKSSGPKYKRYESFDNARVLAMTVARRKPTVTEHIFVFR